MTNRSATFPVTAVVPLGGSGTRLYPITLEVPKHLAPIANRSIFHASSEQYATQGVRTFILGVTGYDNRVQSYSFFGHGGRFNTLELPKGVEFFYATYEDRDYKEKGSADVFFWVLDNYKPVMDGNDILQINGDNLSDLSFENFYEAHKKRDALVKQAMFDVLNKMAIGEKIIFKSQA
jgi:NDP-sugar pyrophosphorylase family protein